MNNRKSATEGENRACEVLKRAGYNVIERNFRTRAGEIDIVAKDGDTYVFVEVKARSDASFGHPAEAVTPAKMYKLANAARQWLTQNGVKNKPCRFDVVALLGDDAEIVKNAFDVMDAARGAYSVRASRR